MKRLFASAAVVIAVSSLTGCSKGDKELKIASVGNTMAFDVTGLTVKTGEKVKLVLKNNGDTPAMTHNWVLVQPGSEASVATSGMEAGEAAGYLKAGDPNVIANTPMAPPGQTVEVTFTAPAPGLYPYICTYPGHYTVMKGTLQVTE